VAGKVECATPQIVDDAKYKPGQIWSYKTRASESSSTITILRVETLPKAGIILHIRIDGIRLKNCAGGPSPTTIQHAPFTKAAIDMSVTRMLRNSAELPDFEDGYRDWLGHCGGVYTIAVAEMVRADEATFNAGSGCGQ